MKNSPIGIIDSGVGGLSIYQEIVKLLPHESIIYLCDQANVPYGTRNNEQITQLSEKMIGFLQQQSVKLVIIACNTISVTCLDDLRYKFPQFPIIGTVPVVKTATAVTKNKHIGILTTKKTAASTYQDKLIQQFASDCSVTTIGTTHLVPFVEQGQTHGLALQKMLTSDLQPFITEKVDTVALACTHFPFLASEIGKVLGSDVIILDSGSAVSRQTQAVLEKHDILSEDTQALHLFYTTGKATDFKRVAKKLLKQHIVNVSHIDL